MSFTSNIFFLHFADYCFTFFIYNGAFVKFLNRAQVEAEAAKAAFYGGEKHESSSIGQ